MTIVNDRLNGLIMAKDLNSFQKLNFYQHKFILILSWSVLTQTQTQTHHNQSLLNEMGIQLSNIRPALSLIHGKSWPYTTKIRQQKLYE